MSQPESQGASGPPKGRSNTNCWQQSYHQKDTWLQRGFAEGTLVDLDELIHPHGDHEAIKQSGGMFLAWCECCQKSFKCNLSSISDHFNSKGHRETKYPAWREVRQISHAAKCMSLFACQRLAAQQA